MKYVVMTILSAGFSVNAFGSLILLSTTPTFNVSGSGLGAVNTLLTLQSPAASATETGCVAPSGAGAAPSTTGGCAGFANANVLTGAAQIGAPTLASLGITSVAQLGIVLNAAEPGGTANSLRVDNVALTLYGTGGNTATFTCESTGTGACAGANLPATQTGTGASGFLFILDPIQAAQAGAFVAANGGANVRLGLGAALANATGGNETFYATALQPGAPGDIPEPATLVLTATGLLVAALIGRRRSLR